MIFKYNQSNPDPKANPPNCCLIQDKEDDQLIGVKSTALRFGDNSKIWLTAFAATMCSGLVGTGVMCDQAWPYYLGVGMVSSHLAYQVSMLPIAIRVGYILASRKRTSTI